MGINIFSRENNKTVIHIYYGLIIALIFFYFIALVKDKHNKVKSEAKLESLRHTHNKDCMYAEHHREPGILTVDQMRTLIQLESHKCDESITKQITESVRNGAMLGFATGIISSDLNMGIRNAVTLGLINGVLKSLVTIVDPVIT